jgi:hypothetical protein
MRVRLDRVAALPADLRRRIALTVVSHAQVAA